LFIQSYSEFDIFRMTKKERKELGPDLKVVHRQHDPHIAGQVEQVQDDTQRKSKDFKRGLKMSQKSTILVNYKIDGIYLKESKVTKHDTPKKEAK
jgi:hypothetical protein